jgi:hypothetical protein
MAKASSTTLPFWIIMILAVCLFSLAVHFYAESLIQNDLFSTGSESAGHYDDTIVIASMESRHSGAIIVQIFRASLLYQPSLALSPLLPPPNF